MSSDLPPRPSQRITFEGGTGHLLAARLDLPAGPARGYALLAHCFTCSKDLPAAGRIAGELTRQEIAVLRFDFTGLGDSGGNFTGTDFSSNLDDLRCAAAWLAATHQAPSLLVGHSLGGAAVLAVAPELSTVRAVATIGAPADTDHLRHLFADDVEEIQARGQATVLIGDRPFTVRRDLLDDLARHAVLDATSRLDAALLVLHAPTDNTVGIDHAGRIFQSARHPRSFLALDRADHLLTDPDHARYAGRLIATWAHPYLHHRPEGGPAPTNSK